MKYSKHRLVIAINYIELNNRNNSLNLLRLVFATFVLIWHAFPLLGVENNLPGVVNYILSLAVPCFFVVSGYLITASAIKNDFRTFFKKRFARIYPAYFLSLLLVVILFAPIVFTLKTGNFNLYNYLSQDPSPITFFSYNLPLILLKVNIGDILSSFISTNNWNGSAWTLIFEFCCYIAIALLIIVLNKFKIKKEHFAKIIFGIYALLIFISFLYPKYDDLLLVRFNYFIYAVFLFSIFLGGSIVYLIKDKLKFSFKQLILAIVFCILVMTYVPSYWAIEICAIPMIYIILFIAVTLKSPKFIQENDISYGVYIYAWPIQCVIACFIAKYRINISVWMYLVICLIIVAIFAIVSWFLLEKPILNRVR